MTDLRELEEKMDQYDQDRKRLQYTVEDLTEQLLAKRTEVDRLKAELKATERVCVARRAMNAKQVTRLKERDAEIERLKADADGENWDVSKRRRI